MLSLEESLLAVYRKFKLNFYRTVFKRFEVREASLTTSETFCVEVIHALDLPTVSEFSDFVQISKENAAYKIQNLIKKGYVQKLQSEQDRREFKLIVTEKFFRYYGINSNYVAEVAKRFMERFSVEEVRMFTYMLSVMDAELMPEIMAESKDELRQ